MTYIPNKRFLYLQSNLKSFLECVKSGNVEKVTKLTNKGLDPNFHDHSTGGIYLKGIIWLLSYNVV